MSFSSMKFFPSYDDFLLEKFDKDAFYKINNIPQYFIDWCEEYMDYMFNNPKVRKVKDKFLFGITNALFQKLSKEKDLNTLDMFTFSREFNFLEIKEELKTIVRYLNSDKRNENEDKIDWKNITFDELHEKASEFVEYLTKIQENVIEVDTENIIVEIGNFYWVDLKTNICSIEHTLMNHCGKDEEADTLYSLREKVQIGTKTYARGILTASKVGTTITQMKGVENTIPKKQYHDHIIELLIKDNITAVNTEEGYHASANFRINQLDESSIRKLAIGNKIIIENEIIKLPYHGIVEIMKACEGVTLTVNIYDFKIAAKLLVLYFENNNLKDSSLNVVIHIGEWWKEEEITHLKEYNKGYATIKEFDKDELINFIYTNWSSEIKTKVDKSKLSYLRTDDKSRAITLSYNSENLHFISIADSKGNIKFALLNPNVLK